MRLVASAYAWKLGPSRRFKLWTDVPAREPTGLLSLRRRAGGLCVERRGDAEARHRGEALHLSQREGPGVSGASLLNGVMDALDAAFAIAGADLALGRNTLSGTAYSCRIDGRPLKDPGDLDGDACSSCR